MEKSVLDLIETFLTDRRYSQGGYYADVEDVDLEQLHAIFTKLIDLKFEPYPDGDLPLSIQITNLHTHLKVPFTRISKEPSASRACSALKLSSWASNLASGDMEEIASEEYNATKVLTDQQK